jgi:ribonuclease D
MTDHQRPFSKEEVNTLPLYRYDGDVLLVHTPEALAEALARMRREWVLGLDTESRPNFRKGGMNNPALLQIACSDVVYIIQLLQTGIDDDLCALLEDPTILKAGVAIVDDMRLLCKIRSFSAAGAVDLGAQARKRGLSTQGLRTLAANFLAARISKGAQCSNWELKKLSPQQVRYAATDAWASREIFLRMDELGFFAC